MFVVHGLHHQVSKLVVGAAGLLPGGLGARGRPPLGLGSPLGLGGPLGCGGPLGGELAELLGGGLGGGAPLGHWGGPPLGLLRGGPLGLSRSLGGLLESLDLSRGELGLLDGQLGLLGGEVALVGLLLVSGRLEGSWSGLLGLEPLLLLGSGPELLLLGSLLELLLLGRRPELLLRRRSELLLLGSGPELLLLLSLLELLLRRGPGGQAALQLLELLGGELLRLAGLLDGDGGPGLVDELGDHGALGAGHADRRLPLLAEHGELAGLEDGGGGGAHRLLGRGQGEEGGEGDQAVHGG